MPEKLIGKLIFSSVLGYYGLELCLKDTKQTIYNVTKETASGFDLILISLFYYRDVLLLEDFLRASGLKDKRTAILLAGGMQSTITPEIISILVDYVFIGDGEEHLENILNEYIQDGTFTNKYLYSGKGLIPSPAVAENIKPIAYMHSSLKHISASNKRKGGIQQSKDKKASTLYRVEIARGCKYKCPFCVMSGLKPYREVNKEEIFKCIESIPSRKMASFFAPDRASHKYWDEIQNRIKEKNIIDCGQDVRLESLLKIENESATIGIEGLSLKLRKSIGKNFSTDFIFDRIKEFCTTGKRKHWGSRLSLYYIADLPGECEDDFNEFKELLEKLSISDFTRHTLFRFILNPLSPKPFTKLKDAEIHPFINYDRKWKTILRGGDGNSRWGIKIVEQRVWLCYERILDAIVHRGGKKGYEIIKDLKKRNLTKIYMDWDKSERASNIIMNRCNDIGLSEDILFKGKLLPEIA